MSIPGYIDYQRREYCKDVSCPVQLALNTCPEDSPDHAQLRSECRERCRSTTYQFHHWLIGKGYLLVRPENRP